MAEVKDGSVIDIRMALGAVAPTVIRSRDIEKMIRGEKASEIRKNIRDIVRAYASLIKPIDDQRSTAIYRSTVALNLIEYFLRREVTI